MRIREIDSVSALVEAIRADTENWTRDGFSKPWFRGVKDAQCHRLIPSILRNNNAGKEFEITTKFRLLAPGFGAAIDRGNIDQWLFLMQHHGVPTRLLDWTENILAAAYFATEHSYCTDDIGVAAAIYALDPMELNRFSDVVGTSGDPAFPNTWVNGKRTLQTIKFAFGTQGQEVDGKKVEYFSAPVAIYPASVHPRVVAQKGCFTLHGSDTRDIEAIFANEKLVNEGYLLKYEIPPALVSILFRELLDLGVTRTTIFPDLDGLAEELRISFGIE